MLLFGVCGHMIVLTAFPCQIDCFALDCLICASFDGYRHGGAYFCCKLSCAHCWTNGVWVYLLLNFLLFTPKVVVGLNCNYRFDSTAFTYGTNQNCGCLKSC